MTLPYAHIACFVDGSPTSEAALVHAQALAVAAGARLSLVHVAPRPLLVERRGGRTVARPEDLSVVERRRLEDRAARVPGAEAVHLEGLPVPAAVAWLEGSDVDLVVTGAARTRTERILMGSFSGGLVLRAPCPVLIVRHRRPREEGTR
ncbi:MAG: universal stress protein [Thermoleophilia bacterium]